ncbi:MAG: CDP-alcohol phosphatidyltransferase family protein [Muribaculaceae bacterium]|nr:CDP-alcohol phosphatidyltransferase family protein [Muribaculaceae bacterium]
MTANIITGIRVLCSIVLLFCTALSPAFYTLYIIAGASDVLDGWVARRTNLASELGAKLDSAADCFFVVVCLIKLLPVLAIPLWIYLWIGIIAAIKFINIISGFILQRQFVAVHSISNKLTGALLFAIPLTLPLIELQYSATLVCLLATFAALEEGHIIRTNKIKQQKIWKTY